MHLRRIAVFFLASSLACAAALAQGSVAERYLLAAANAERAQRGIPPLRWDNTLYRAAQFHAQEMAARQTISHRFPGEAELADRGKNVGARFSRIAENVGEASSAVRIHDAWMHSPGHRENLLDPSVDSVAISVLSRKGQLYAVQDFERTVQSLSLDEQEAEVARLLETSTSSLDVSAGEEEARRTCAMDSGYVGRQPWFVMRYTAGDLSTLPGTLRQKLATGRYHQASVGACPTRSQQPFTSYSIAVLLYP